MSPNSDAEKLGKYDLVREIGREAMGIVYEGLDPLIGRKVVLKTIRFDVLTGAEAQAEAQQRFMREARAAGSLSHPNIVAIYDVGEDRGLTYIATELIEGESLEAMIAGRRRLSPEDSIALIGQLADALDYAHRNGIVHRDIKPANILIDKEGRPKIADFGIARMAASPLIRTNMVLGTPYYMAPEQIAGRKADHRADLFSLGAILYELLTYEKPFPGENPTTVIYRIINEEPAPPRALVSGLPEGLDRIVTKSLAKDPDRRFQSGREMADALRGYERDAGAAGSQALRPGPASTGAAKAPAANAAGGTRISPAAERHRKPLILIVGGILTLLAVVIGIVFLARRRAPAYPGGGGEGAEAQPPGARPATEVAPGQPSAPPAGAPAGAGTAAKPAAPGEIAERVQLLKAAFQQGQYLRCIDQAQAVLRLEPGQAEAKSFLDMAVLKQAPLDIEAMLGEYTGILTKMPTRLALFWDANAAPALAPRLRAEAAELLSDHEEFQVSASPPVLSVSDIGTAYRAEATFSEVLTAVSRAKKMRVLLYEGKIRWTLERTDRWRIVKIDALATNAP